MSTAPKIGDWVVIDLDVGRIVRIAGDRAEIIWCAGGRTTLDLSSDGVDVYATGEAANSRWERRAMEVES